MSFRAETVAEGDRLAELVRASAYVRQKADLYVQAVELYHQAAEMIAAGAKRDHLVAMKRQLEHAGTMLAGALHDAKDVIARARMMSPGHHEHIANAAESGRSLSQ